MLPQSPTSSSPASRGPSPSARRTTASARTSTSSSLLRLAGWWVFLPHTQQSSLTPRCNAPTLRNAPIPSQQTILNTSGHPIYPGDLIEWTFASDAAHKGGVASNRAKQAPRRIAVQAASVSSPKVIGRALSFSKPGAPVSTPASPRCPALPRCPAHHTHIVHRGDIRHFVEAVGCLSTNESCKAGPHREKTLGGRGLGIESL